MLKFGGICIEKLNFQSTKKSINIIQFDIYRVLVLNRYLIAKKSFKYFISYVSHSDDIMTSLSNILLILKGSLKSLEKIIYLRKYYKT